MSPGRTLGLSPLGSDLGAEGLAGRFLNPASPSPYLTRARLRLLQYLLTDLTSGSGFLGHLARSGLGRALGEKGPHVPLT